MNRAFRAIGLVLIPFSATALAQSAPRPASEVKAAFHKLVDRPRIPLDFKTSDPKPRKPGLVVERLDFASEAKANGTVERVPVLLVRPETTPPGERRAAVIVLHGTGGNKEGLSNWLDDLARLGFVAVAIDGRYHGERSGGLPGTRAYNDAIVAAWRTPAGQPQAHPFYLDTVWDVWRTIDYLETRPDVDPSRIGLAGISKGGIETWLGGAADDRVKVAVPMIGVQSFRWSLDHDQWQARAKTIQDAHKLAASDLGKSDVDRDVCLSVWPKLIPGILDDFDGPSMLRLFAGRSLLILNGEKDPNCPLGGTELAIASARAAFHEVGADDHFQAVIAPGVGHAVTPAGRKLALEWFTKWLEPGRTTASGR